MYLVVSVWSSVCSSVRLSISASITASVDIRGLALLSVAKSKEESLSVQVVCLCVESLRRCGRSAFILISVGLDTVLQIGCQMVQFWQLAN